MATATIVIGATSSELTAASEIDAGLALPCGSAGACGGRQQESIDQANDAQCALPTEAAADQVASKSPAHDGTCVLLGFDDGVLTSFPKYNRKALRATLFGENNEIIEILCSEAPTLELELDFQSGRIILQGSDTDVARALPQVRALVENVRPELRRAVAELLVFVAKYCAEETMEEQLAKQFEVRLKNLPPAPVPQSLLQLQHSHFQSTESFVQVLPGRCWLVPGVLTSQECDDWICKAQMHGLETSKLDAGRYNNRTKDFIDLDMTQLVRSRLPPGVQREVEMTSPNTDVRSVHEEWRISKYQPGQYFRAHYDESYTRGYGRNSEDSGRIIRNLEGEQGETSSHTLLLFLTDTFSKGATRFWPTGSYDEAVDVTAPRGSMLVFEQRTLLHEGCALEDGVKFVAQGALMRAPPPDFILDPNRPTFDKGFRFGPGMSSYDNATKRP